MEWIQLNIVYAIQHRHRVLGKEDLHFPKAELLEMALFGTTGCYTDGNGRVHKKEEQDEKAKTAVYQRFLMEQAGRTKEVIEELCAIKGVRVLPADCFSVLKTADYIDGGHEPRHRDARWHISYHCDADRARIENVMKRIGCTNFELYKGIDECIKEFKV